VFHDLQAPSPQVNLEEIARRNPDAIIAADRGRDQILSKPQWRSVAAARDSHFIIEDPSLTGRPSVVLGMAAVTLARALHPELADQLPSAPRRSP
jgi:ABC-type Fe3+-hydroxamate transport system substrate-binding protein